VRDEYMVEHRKGILEQGEEKRKAGRIRRIPTNIRLLLHGGDE
jgi:hypothetical protein